MIPGKIFTIFAQFWGIVSVNDFLVSSLAPGTPLGSSGSPGKFKLYTGRIVSTELPNLVPQQRIDDCVEIHFLQ